MWGERWAYRGRLLSRLLIAAMVLPGSTLAAREPLLFRTAGGLRVTLEEALQDLRQARVVFMGETHDNPADHAAQLKVIRSLHESGRKVALGLEMFRASAQGQLDGWVEGRLDEAQLASVFAENWESRLWPLYRDIFRVAREKRLPMIGLNVPRVLVSQVAKEGFASLSEEQRRGIGVVTCNADPRYRRVMREVLGLSNEDSGRFQHFCEAQLVWDTAMARRIAEFSRRSPGGVIVVLAGVFHAWKHGIPEQLSSLSRLPYRVILPSGERSVLRYDIMVKDADYVWWHE